MLKDLVKQPSCHLHLHPVLHLSARFPVCCSLSSQCSPQFLSQPLLLFTVQYFFIPPPNDDTTVFQGALVVAVLSFGRSSWSPNSSLKSTQHFFFFNFYYLVFFSTLVFSIFSLSIYIFFKFGVSFHIFKSLSKDSFHKWVVHFIMTDKNYWVFLSVLKH